jgi:hypothetical protein
MPGPLGRRGLKQIGLIDFEQRSRGVGAFQVATQPDELPSLPMNHGGVGGAFEQIDAVGNRGQRVADAGRELRLRVRRMHLLIQPVQPLPLLG